MRFLQHPYQLPEDLQENYPVDYILCVLRL